MKEEEEKDRYGTGQPKLANQAQDIMLDLGHTTYKNVTHTHTQLS